MREKPRSTRRRRASKRRSVDDERRADAPPTTRAFGNANASAFRDIILIRETDRVTTSLARHYVSRATIGSVVDDGARAGARRRAYETLPVARASRFATFPTSPTCRAWCPWGRSPPRRLGNHAQERLQRQTRDREQGGEQDGHREAELALALRSFGARPEAKSQSEDTRKRRFPTRSTDRACREKPRRDRARRRRRDGGPSARAARARATAFALATVRVAEHDVPRSSRRAPPSPPCPRARTWSRRPRRGRRWRGATTRGGPRRGSWSSGGGGGLLLHLELRELRGRERLGFGLLVRDLAELVHRERGLREHGERERACHRGGLGLVRGGRLGHGLRAHLLGAATRAATMGVATRDIIASLKSV